jgi:AraC-like DNA-binding protein
MPDATISAGYPKALLDFAIARGADCRELLARSGIRDDNLTDYDNRIPLARYVAMIEAAAELTHQPALALQFGEAVRMQEISIVGLICEACDTAAEVGPQLNRYARLVVDEDRAGPADLIRAVRNDDGLWLEATSEVFASNPLIAEAECARLVCNARATFASSPAFQRMQFPRAIHFMHPAPSYRAEFDRIFQAPVTFGSKWTAMLVDDEFLSLKQPPTNRYVFGVLSDRAEAMLKSLEAAKTVRAQVESLLMPILHKGEVSMDGVAAKLGLSRPTLFRKLRAEGVTFERVLDELRHRLAVHYLTGRKVSVNETAYLVGFADPASFSRAFKRWTGKNPSAVRAAGRIGPANR